MRQLAELTYSVTAAGHMNGGGDAPPDEAQLAAPPPDEAYPTDVAQESARLYVESTNPAIDKEKQKQEAAAKIACEALAQSLQDRAQRGDAFRQLVYVLIVRRSAGP
eukprot:SAG11_NODE_585_length_8349_cov_38.121939_13_plen_107_part_00